MNAIVLLLNLESRCFLGGAGSIYPNEIKALREEVLRLRAAAAGASAGAEWRPIETAPKDGTEIIYMRIYYGTIDDIGRCRWVEAEHECPAEWWDTDADQGANPQFWMPQPPLPAGADAGAAAPKNSETV